MTKNEVIKGILALLGDSGLGFSEQVKVLSEVRVAIQPRLSQTDWRAKSKPILKPKDKQKGK